MKKQLTRAAIAASLLAASLSAAAQTEIKFGHVAEPGSLFALSADEFAKKANAALGNKAKVVVFGSSQLGGDKELLQKHIRQVKTGLPGMAYLRVDPQVAWPAELDRNLVQ